jgi:ABC-type phosphate/phosphonate transport system substrate-binding protein
LQYIEKQGLRTDIDYRAVEYRNHASVVQALLSGASSMAVTTSHGLIQIPSDLRQQVTVYRHVSDIPALVIMAAPDFPKPLREQLHSRLLTFKNEREGLEFLAHNSYTALHDANSVAMRRADPYLKETRRVLAK